MVTEDMAVYYNDDDIQRASDNPPYGTESHPSPAPTFCDWHVGLERGIANGIIKVADTIKELAAIYGINPETLEKTVQEYNECYDSGKDDPAFGKRVECLRPIRKPPFYGIEHGPRILDTTGGVIINENAQVINTNGDVIPGLYAGSRSICGTRGRAAVLGVNGAMGLGYMAGKGAASEALA
jgi:fumarate reductase flavoprotein subunit